ncbi:hypothetical protein BH11BAC3_BH11BAC3_25830 [soil metagenome]
MFDFRLRVFHAIAKHLNFTKDIAELFITQPAVTKHIQEIENNFKVNPLTAIDNFCPAEIKLYTK